MLYFIDRYYVCLFCTRITRSNTNELIGTRLYVALWYAKPKYDPGCPTLYTATESLFLFGKYNIMLTPLTWFFITSYHNSTIALFGRMMTITIILNDKWKSEYTITWKARCFSSFVHITSYT